MSEINIDEIMREIKARAARRRNDEQLFPGRHPEEQPQASHTCGDLHPVDVPPRLRVRRVNDGDALEFRTAYSLADFLQYHDSLFIRNAYRGILGREPDEQGYHYYLTKLRNGAFNKIDVLGRLRYSTEGRYVAKRIRGLVLPFVFNSMCRIPMVGYLVRLGAGILQLPRIINSIYRSEAFTQAQLTAIRQNAGEFAEELEMFLTATAQTINTLIDAVTRNKTDQSSFEQVRREVTALRTEKAGQAELLQVKQQIQHLSHTKADKETLTNIQQQLAEINVIANELRGLHITIQRALQQLREFQQKMLAQEHEFTEAIDELQEALAEEEMMRGASYAAFEENFRGTREEVKRRLGIYMPYLEQLPPEIKTMTMLDLGCGRGEWLELLQEHAYRAIGVEINHRMIEACRSSGFDVIEDDAINYIKNLEAESMGVVTGFHVIEHLTLRNRIRLFDETLRVLAPGGMAIFETPNPENLMVGACEFYSDPTHKRPIPPATLQYFMQSCGFLNTVILRVNKNEQQPADNQPVESLLSVEKDYAVIGYKG